MYQFWIKLKKIQCDQLYGELPKIKSRQRGPKISKSCHTEKVRDFVVIVSFSWCDVILGYLVTSWCRMELPKILTSADEHFLRTTWHRIAPLKIKKYSNNTNLDWSGKAEQPAPRNFRVRGSIPAEAHFQKYMVHLFCIFVADDHNVWYDHMHIPLWQRVIN